MWRSIVLSFFQDYFNDKGELTLREYSNPVDLSIFDKNNWMLSEKHVWYIPKYLEKIPHEKIVDKNHVKTLRKVLNLK